MSARPTQAGRLDHIEEAIGAAVRRLAARIRNMRRRRRDAQQLMTLNDRMLKDIGIDRSEIMSFVYGGGRTKRYENGRE